MSAQPAPFVENRADYERSVQWARDRSNAGDDTLEICPHCMCEIDADPQPHRPGCPGIGAPRVSTDAVLAGDVVAPVREVEPVDGLDALERMDAGLPQIADVGDEPDLDELLEAPEPAPAPAPSDAAVTDDNPFGLQKMGRGYVWTPEASILAVKAFAVEHGRPPRVGDAKNATGALPAFKSAERLFGSWEKLVAEAGLTPAAVPARPKRPPRVSRATKDSSSKGAVSQAEEEGPRSPTPPAGGLDDEQPAMAAPTPEATVVVAGAPEPRPAPDHDPEPQLPAEPRDHQIVSAAIDASGEERLAWIDRLHREANRAKIRGAALDQIADGLRVLHDLHQDDEAAA